MTTSSHLPSSATAITEASPYGGSPDLELMFIQDEAGRYLSFSWPEAARYGLGNQPVLGNLSEAPFQPVNPARYLQHLRTVLDGLVPIEIEYPFRLQGQHLLLALNVSPHLSAKHCNRRAVVTGSVCRALAEQEAIAICHGPVQVASGHEQYYQTKLDQVAWDIRRTLDIETIWQKTVDGLGSALNAARCIVYPCRPGCQVLEAVAEYHKPALSPTEADVLQLAEVPQLLEAISTLTPIFYCENNHSEAARDEAAPAGEGCGIIAMPTIYQNEANGLIILHQANRKQLAPQEISVIQEFAQQVGTGIAHATLFAESRDLAVELLQVNEQLLKKHSELEEAHQQAEEASRLKSEFLANTSHELRTPLNAMIGFLKLVLDGMADDPEEQEEFINEAYRSAVHLLNIINDILDIARIEAGKMQLEMNPVTLDDLLIDVENFTRTQAEQKDLYYKVLTPATRDRIVLYGNYQRLLQVLLNLIGNAIKFTHEGGITITADVEESQQEINRPRMVKLGVADTGIGVSLEDQDKLFQSFSQVDGSRTRRFGGSGLGLVISQKLVEAMGGVVNFFSMGEGLGSTVTFTVPLYQEPVMVDSQE
ncbi:MAG: ATP-binding protein [Elainellaceae cyanobacterium]